MNFLDSIKSKISNKKISDKVVLDMEEITEREIASIINSLDLKDDDDFFSNLYNTLQVHEYLVLNNEHIEDGGKFEKEAIYKAIVGKTATSASNAFEFKTILDKIGIQSEIYLFSACHYAVLVLLGNEYYIFDPTWDRDKYAMEGEESYNPTFAAMGKNIYQRVYTPEKSLPINTSEESVSKRKIKEMMGAKCKRLTK